MAGRVELRDSAAGVATTSPHGVSVDMTAAVASPPPLPCSPPSGSHPPPSKPVAEGTAYSSAPNARNLDRPHAGASPAAGAAGGDVAGSSLELGRQGGGNGLSASGFTSARGLFKDSSRPGVLSAPPLHRCSQRGEAPTPFTIPRRTHQAWPGRAKRERSLIGPILLGSGSSGEHVNANIERCVDDCAQSAVHVAGGIWSFKVCGIACAGGVALVCVDGAEAELKRCSIGGIADGDSSAYNGIVALNHSTWSLTVSTIPLLCSCMLESIKYDNFA